ncbi:hypothetical protein SAMN02745127_01904 [Oceanospirillum multiglobuliferum]|uniref:Uncharacterized protein n=1 Tax=Oceanospirillum multiglobuliferum TaxID=64969 RepID=A0A1T4QK20_9GAMM|nr:hypothetical protein [Oceanospirillum multiglobuliferum]OPX56412.1 hypothetical protein BTE48_02995 [Oceanospirillum multiglobuliferum]SKA04069.1 hypothetical protein SAMN02745127_01904 [Oceanospirillum multiglobuliferum]
MKALASTFSRGIHLSGLLLVLTWMLTLLDTLNLVETTTLATCLAWGFVVLEFPSLTRKQTTPILILMLGGLGFALWAWLETGHIDLLGMADEHIKLAMLLTAVSFIRLATRVHAGDQCRGFKSFFMTFSGMHLFSSVANFSSLFLFGDQIKQPQAQGALVSPLSYRLLTRGFSLAIFWSPFLSMIPLVLELVPGTNMSAVYPWALSLVAFGFILTLIEARLREPKQLSEYQGYPIQVSSLALPLLLISTLLMVHQLLPDVPMLALISSVAVLVPILWVLVVKGSNETWGRIKGHVQQQLPNTRPEISLFLAAGFLAAGVKTCISAGLIASPFDHTDALVASIVMLLIFFISSLGIHQFALMAIFAGLMSQVTTTPHLMAIAYMVGVSLSMSGSLFSGVNIIIQNQFKVSSTAILRDNMPYSLIMLAFSSGMLFVMESMGVR